jgi:hypothetical protein
VVGRSQREASLEAFRAPVVAEMPYDVVDALVEKVCLRVADIERGKAVNAAGLQRLATALARTTVANNPPVIAIVVK